MIADLKHYPTMKDSGIDSLGKVPAHWEVRRLKDTVLGCVNGVWGSDPNGSDDLPCVRVADFDRDRLRVKHSVPTLRAISQSERQRKTLSSGDLLLEKSGGGEQQPVGTVVLFDHEAAAVCSNFIARMPVREGYSPHFLTYLHSTLYAKGLNKRSIKQTTGIQNLDSSAYLSEFAGLPPLPEQTAIVRYLDHIDRRVRRLVRAKRKLIALLIEQKQAIMHRAVTRGLDPDVPLKDSGVEWLGDVPEHWEVVSSKALFAHRKEKASEGDEMLTASQAHGIIPRDEFIEKQGRVMQVITGADILKRVEPNDFVISMRSFQGGLEWSKLQGAVSSAYVTLVPKKDVYPHFFSYLFKTKAYITALRRTSDLVRDGQALRYANFAQVPLPVIPRNEQKTIAEHLDKATADIDTTIARAECEIELLTEYRTRLIADVVTGELDVRYAAAALPEADPLAEDDDADDLDSNVALDADELDEAPEEVEA